MVNNVALTNSTILSPQAHMPPEEVERQKTNQQRAEDWIYTFNHSFTCLGFTDTFGLTMAANSVNAIEGLFIGKKGNHSIDHDHDNGYGAWDWFKDRVTGKHRDKDYVHKIHHEENDRIKADHHHHDHDHGPKHDHHHHDHKHDHHDHSGHNHAAHDHHHHDHGHNHPDPAPKLTPESGAGEAAGKFWTTSKRWLAAEAVGDIGAVPFTIMMQRLTPGFMEKVRAAIEPSIGGVFRANTQRAAENWGGVRGFAADSKEVKDRAHEIYEYEMKHIPQMAVWTVSSIGLNYGAMHVFHKINPRQFENTTLKEFAKVKGLGAAITAGVVLLIRGIIPGGAHKWDQTVGKYVVAPMTKAAGSLVGIKSEDVDRFNQQRADNGVELDEHDLLPAALNKAKEKKDPKEHKEAHKEEAKPQTPPPAAPKTTVEGATAQHSAPQPMEASLAV